MVGPYEVALLLALGAVVGAVPAVVIVLVLVLTRRRGAGRTARQPAALDEEYRQLQEEVTRLRGRA